MKLAQEFVKNAVRKHFDNKTLVLEYRKYLILESLQDKILFKFKTTVYRIH